MKAYKVFENDWTCQGKQYEIGKTYSFDGDLEMCVSGFHACLKLKEQAWSGKCFRNIL